MDCLGLRAALPLEAVGLEEMRITAIAEPNKFEVCYYNHNKNFVRKSRHSNRALLSITIQMRARLPTMKSATSSQTKNPRLYSPLVREMSYINNCFDKFSLLRSSIHVDLICFGLMDA